MVRLFSTKKPDKNIDWIDGKRADKKAGWKYECSRPFLSYIYSREKGLWNNKSNSDTFCIPAIWTNDFSHLQLSIRLRSLNSMYTLHRGWKFCALQNVTVCTRWLETLFRFLFDHTSFLIKIWYILYQCDSWKKLFVYMYAT